MQDTELFRQKALIGGNWCHADRGHVLEVVNPASGKRMGTVPDMGAAETRRAIDAAKAALSGWKARTNAERAQLLEAWYSLMLAHKEDLGLLLTMEQGKPLSEAVGEISYGASFVKWFANEALRIGGQTIPSPTTDRRIVVLKQPVGVCAIITPWNFPNATLLRKVAPALAAGCTVVIKPSEFTPYSALALGVLAERAGIPAGVLNIVTGMPGDIGPELTGSPVIRKLSFTGSTRVGAQLMRECSSTVKRLSLELGGNAPFIVFDDADIETAIKGVIASKFRNGGQTCVCANRILVQSGIYDVFAARLAERVNAMKVGVGTEPGVDIGPMINSAAVEKIDLHIEDALGKGARRLTDQAPLPEGALFRRPVVLGGATQEMLLAHEETFGPVAPLFRFETEEEAIAIANGTPFGLASYFFTESHRRAWRVGEALEFGIVGLNTGLVSLDVAPFGGVKQSGFGREGGQIGIEEYLEIKTFHLGGLD